MSAYGHGRHEHGQNFLTNHKIINSIIDLAVSYTHLTLPTNREV